ncbi:DUF3866 family protein [Ornithinimicrobium pratense]|uniref:DUF3866 family protein n=1 Tax=Ornithinimicrobium pratense TaxID=2593973 RepID=A0A5J6V4H6_9MICO|nr:DUF3866 family protein [Ornithinimicrobium pratense]QFG68658.1 DUF3866 family protein [Ornithinimicrobium pratense]
MIRWRQGVVREVLAGWPGVVPVSVEITPGDGTTVPALAYVDVVGTPEAGDRVLLNTTALDRGLGTGGYAVVTAIPDRPSAWPAGWAVDPDAPGHLVKARYSPLQTMVLGVDDPEGEHHAVLEAADSIDGMPVVAADLHSSLPAIVAGVRLAAEQEGREAPTVAYVMTDGGALPLAFSRSVATLRDAGWLSATVTCGQAYGGDLEAVTVHTALLAARHVIKADLAVVVQGPGNLGTGTRWGFSGVAAGEALNAAAVLGGRPVAALRVSQADPRGRHRGLSHHSATAYGRVLTRPADLVVPVPGPGTALELRACLDQVHRQAGALVATASHLRLVEVATDGLLERLRDTPVRLSTMGRGLDEDTAAFLAAAAAGSHAVRISPSPRLG